MQGIVRVRGRVQGVGFRPFVYRLAKELELEGWVRNGSEGVEISIRGKEREVGAFLLRLKSESPVSSKVEAVEFEPADADDAANDFRIESSREGGAATEIPPDLAVCGKCLEELFDSSNRRYRHPFIHCTDCGPRYTFLSGLPYDRERTSMAAFELCPACRSEYLDPSDRRFHAQPIACNDCGPALLLLDDTGAPLEGDPIEKAVEAILSGKILAIKGMGGFHLVCDAGNESAVARLRSRKSRMEKPFALMAANCASVSRFAVPGQGERELLESMERPVVLLGKREESGKSLPGVAPGLPFFGFMLPCAPLHYLLFHEAAGRPEGLAWLGKAQPLLLVATSANPAGEPIVSRNDEAIERLRNVADLFLLHDREILARCDDSVVRWNGKAPQFVRRARGHAPSAWKLPFSGPSVLACGAGYKNTFCLTRENEAFVSQHVGELDNASACAFLEKSVGHLLDLLEIEPEMVVRDLHPDFFSSRFAEGYARKKGIPLLAVQHHHAHVAAVMAEHGAEDAVLGIALDGVGLGEDGEIWGGELLLADERGGFSRLGHLAELSLPGGDRAAREPWRMAASVLHALGREEEIVLRYGRRGAELLGLIESRLCRRTGSAGRWFDAAAALLAGIENASFEGQAALLLEALARRHGPVGPMEGGFLLEGGILDFLPLFEVLAETEDAEYGAALFHSTLAEGLKAWACAMSGRISTVALSGGCFLNSVLSRELRSGLEREGYAVLEAGAFPPNDGGISLGQAYVAMQRGIAACA